MFWRICSLLNGVLSNARCKILRIRTTTASGIMLCNAGSCSGVGGWLLLVRLYQYLYKSTPKAVFMLMDHKAVYSCLHTSAFSLVFYLARLPPEEMPGMSDVTPLSGISGLSFYSQLLSPLLFFCLVLLLFLFYHFSVYGSFSWLFSPENSNIFREELGFFVSLFLSS